jgi:ubiquinone/menaquinone biosynthesis C-methylase UbiE
MKCPLFALFFYLPHFMNTQDAYNHWAPQYDSNENKTRDLEGEAMRSLLADEHVARCLELGCGTGKNTEWLLQKAEQLTAVDFSEEMLGRARQKLAGEVVQFVQADIEEDWRFAHGEYALITCSLVLEHIEALDPIFSKAAGLLASGGLLYVGELHPFKQYSGSKARFDTAAGTTVITGYTHHLTDYLGAAQAAGLQLLQLQEFFDEGDRRGQPRILAMLFKKG